MHLPNSSIRHMTRNWRLVILLEKLIWRITSPPHILWMLLQILGWAISPRISSMALRTLLLVWSISLRRMTRLLLGLTLATIIAKLLLRLWMLPIWQTYCTQPLGIFGHAEC